MKDWQYLERSLHRIIAGWGRHFEEWDDITTCHRQVWEQSECVRKLRERLAQFPGAAQHLEAPVSSRLESLVNTVLLAPSFQDAVDGIYGVLMPALTRSYQLYGATAHPIHDAPTLTTLHDIIGLKEGMRLWRADFRRRFSHTTNIEYLNAIKGELEKCGDLLQAVPLEAGDAGAAAVGIHTDFRLPADAGRPVGSLPEWNIVPYIVQDFQTSVEARRLFWCYGYLLELNLAMDQLRWIYDGHFMPWEFLQDVSRHMWDESRHGDSGHSRLLDFGIDIPDIGFPSYVQLRGDGSSVEPLSPKELYEEVYSIGMIGETGHFPVKRQAYDDFRDGGDLESAEMMLFDIIDETAHVQYAHKWLPTLAQHAGETDLDYKARGAHEREENQRAHLQNLEKNRTLPDESDSNYIKYQQLLAIMRAKQPLSNQKTCATRDPLPM